MRVSQMDRLQDPSRATRHPGNNLLCLQISTLADTLPARFLSLLYAHEQLQPAVPVNPPACPRLWILHLQRARPKVFASLRNPPRPYCIALMESVCDSPFPLRRQLPTCYQCELLGLQAGTHRREQIVYPALASVRDLLSKVLK